MRIEQEFVVEAPPESVWAFLTDPERVAAALPGAELTERVDDRTFKGKITVRVGPISPSFKGTVSFERMDHDSRTAEIVASGRGLDGVGNAELRMVGKVGDNDTGGSRVTLTSETAITGMLAQFGRGMIQEVSNQMLEKFAEAMRAELEQ